MQQRFRILCVGETWFGSDSRAAFAALRRLGHSIQVVDQNNYVPSHWQSNLGKAIRKVFLPVFVKELMRDLDRMMEQTQPHCLFVFKGNWVHPKVIEHCRSLGVATINYYPDVSFLSHGPYIPDALPHYDQVFNTKSYGVGDMESRLGVRNVRFLEPGYDPELHRPRSLTIEDVQTYGCDVAFIGTWSPKKEAILIALRKALPEIRIKIWGFQWDPKRAPQLKGSIMGYGVIGEEYTKAICGSAICLGLLSEIGLGSSSGDLITARTFQIPACQVFMLHERNPEVVRYFEEGRDAEFFDSSEELARKVEHYLADAERRKEVARSGLLRSREEDYSIDSRMRSVVSWLALKLNTDAGRLVNA